MQQLIKYIKDNSEKVALGCGFFLWLLSSKYPWLGNILLIGYIGLIVAFSCLARYKSYKALKAKGLTFKDVRNASFVKKWELTRKSGYGKFVFQTGGLLFGAMLFTPVAFDMFYFIGLPEAIKGLGRLTALFGLCVVGCYVAGASIFSLRWSINERRFLRLTDPLSFLQKP
ncbi:hypothetical protein C8P68_106317 [Mucilaginibacter yixingensis]|uniref:Uncharacterized protein n=1 Tax=Mucilaginibacter yixingensis TaxID=1295612 RepID=A0A2T5J7H5_9SPHI|nr:hypothetical protein [Mucilaginibacter yixingensis]PTQ95102.1 hypothetical protein C8P68_106317 [Mucilaginibacter yixingensis]